MSSDIKLIHYISGVGLGAPGLFLGLYGSAQYPGGQTMEYRNALICRAFGDNRKELAEEEIQNFYFDIPSGKSIYLMWVKWPRGIVRIL